MKKFRIKCMEGFDKLLVECLANLGGIPRKNSDRIYYRSFGRFSERIAREIFERIQGFFSKKNLSRNFCRNLSEIFFLKPLVFQNKLVEKFLEPFMQDFQNNPLINVGEITRGIPPENLRKSHRTLFGNVQ